MDGALIFAVFLVLMCAALLVAEVFVPSGGFLTVFSIACLAGGITLFFQHSVFTGWVGVGVSVVLVPTSLFFAYKLFPKTKFGKTVTLKPPDRTAGDAIPDTDKLQALVGELGIVKSPLHPIGVCDFSGHRVECVAETGYVDVGATVKVIHSQGTQLTVRVVASP